jgi:hypothetical protein
MLQERSEDFRAAAPPSPSMKKLSLWLTRREQAFILFVLALLLLGGIVHAVRDMCTASHHPTENLK